MAYLTLECQANPKAAAQQVGSTMVCSGLHIVPQAKRNLSEEWRRRRWQGRFSVARAFRRPSSPMRVRPCRHYTALASSLLFTLLLSCQNTKPCVCVSETLKIRCLADKRPSWVPSCLSSSSSSSSGSCVCYVNNDLPSLVFSFFLARWTNSC